MVLVSSQRQNTDAGTFRSSLLFHILLKVLEVCVKRMGMLQRLRIAFFNYRGGETAERISEGYFLLTLSTWIGCLKPTVDVVILKPTPFCGINGIPHFCVRISLWQLHFLKMYIHIKNICTFSLYF